jgi:hypothetical protein
MSGIPHGADRVGLLVNTYSFAALRPVRTLMLGTVVGLVVLGIGGRVAMAWVTVKVGGAPSFTLGGTLTVILLGAASGLAGGVMSLASRWVSGRLPGRIQWVQYVLLAAMLALVTARGLRGTQQPGTEWFWALVAVYGVALAWLTAPRRGSARGQTPLAPGLPG